MTDPATRKFKSLYDKYNRSLKNPHPYFQRIEYIKVNKMMIEQVLKRKHERILDIGGGSGFLSMALSEISKESMILDIEGTRLPAISKKNPKIECFCANVESCLPFKQNTFDVIIASELLEHLNDPEIFFSESHRILKKGGRLILTTPNYDNLTYKIFHRLPRSISYPLAKKAGVDLKLHPELMDKDTRIADDPHLHKVEGYTKSQLVDFGRGHKLITIHYKNFGLPVPDKLFSRVPRALIRFTVNHLEDHIPFALRHFIVYENK
jgi:ubiquinone/menaquinone biosynthesis C-methylase UbiE